MNQHHFGGLKSTKFGVFGGGGNETSSEEGSPKNQMLEAVQKQYREEMHDMLDEISMPNQSMTMSNLSQISQSPFRGNTTPSRGAFNFGGANQSLGHTQSETKLSNFMGGIKSQTSLSISNSNANDVESSRNLKNGLSIDNMDTINAVQSAEVAGAGQTSNNQKKNRHVFASDTLGVNSSSDDEEAYRAIGRGINQRNKQRPNQQILNNPLIGKSKIYQNKGPGERLQERFEKQHDLHARDGKVSGAAGQTRTQEDDGLDIADLSTDFKEGQLKQYLQREDSRPAQFGRLEPKEHKRGRDSPDFACDRDLPKIEDDDEQFTSRSNQIPDFKMMMDFSNTPQRPAAERTAGELSSKPNRTFADSVLLGLAGTTGKKEMAGSKTIQDKACAGQAEDFERAGGSKLQTYNFLNKADMSDISAGPPKLFRMGLPMDRGDHSSSSPKSQQHLKGNNNFEREGSDELGLSQLQGGAQLNSNKDSRQDENDDISAMSISQCGGLVGALDKSVNNVSAISGMYTKRSPYLARFKNMDHEESLSMTPQSLGKSENISSQKSRAATGTDSNNEQNMHGVSSTHLTSSQLDLQLNNQKHQAIQNRFMKVIDDQQNKQQEPKEQTKYNTLKPNNSDSIKDPELEEAINHSSRNQPDIGNVEQNRLRVDLSLMNSKYGAQQQQLALTNKQMQEMEALCVEQRKTALQQESRIIELQDQNKLLQQNIRDGTQLPNLLSRAQDNARREISNLKTQLSDRDQLVAKLQRQMQKEQNQESYGQESLIKEIESLCAQLDKQKLLTSGLKNQTQQKETELKSEADKMRQAYESDFMAMNGRIQQMDQYIQSIIKEYHDKENELQQALSAMSVTQEKATGLEKQNQVMQREVAGFQQRCKDLEQELEMSKGNDRQKETHDSMEFEIRKMRETHAKQMSALKEEKSSMNTQLIDAQNKLKAIDADPLQNEIAAKSLEISHFQQLVSQISVLLDLESQEPDPIIRKLQAVMIELEEQHILKSEYQMLQTSYANQQESMEKTEVENQSIQKQLQTLQRQQSAGPSNFTKNLLVQKDQEVVQLKEQLGIERKLKIQAEDQLWHANKENEIKAIQLAETEKLKLELIQLTEANTTLKSKVQELTRSSVMQVEQLKQQLVESGESSKRQKLMLEAQMNEENATVKEMIDQLEQQNERMRKEMDEMIEKEHRREQARRKLVSARAVELQVDPSTRSTKEVGVLAQLDLLPHSNATESASESQLRNLRTQVDSMKDQQEQQEQQYTEEIQKQMQLIEVQQQTVVDFEQQMDSLKKKNQELKTEIIQNQQELQTKGQKIEVMNLEQAELKKEFERMCSNEQKMIADLQLRARDPRSGAEAEKSKMIEELENEKDQLQQALQAQQEKVQELKENQVKKQEQTATQEEATKPEDEELQEQLGQLSALLKSQESQLKDKQSEIETLEYELDELREEVSTLTANEQKLIREALELQETVSNELRTKTQYLDLEQEQIQREKEKMKVELQQKQKSFEESVHQKQIEFDIKENQLEMKFNKQIQNIESDYKDGKESLLSTIYQDHQTQIHELKQAHADELKETKTTIEDLRAEFAEQSTRDMKKQADECEKMKKQAEEKLKKSQMDNEREAKKQREELERIKRADAEKLTKAQAEFKQDLERKDVENKEKVEAAQQKGKKDAKVAQDKVRADMKNAVDAVKNDMARAKCDWDREKKKLNTEYENQLNMLRTQIEDDSLEEVRLAKEKADKQFKKRLQDKENLWQTKFEEIEQEISDLNEAHRVEIKNEKERLEARLREQIRSQLKMEITNELEQDFQQQLQEFERRYQCEIEKIQGELREEKAQVVARLLPQEHKKEISSQQTQTNLAAEPQTERPINDEQLSIMQKEIDQIKEQYNEKLQEQMKKSATEITPRDMKLLKNDMIKHFENVLNYEFEKILMSLRMKSQNLSQDELNSKRNEINKQIQKILYHNKDYSLKKSMDNIKKKISEVLKLFKESLEDKSNSRIKDLEKKLEAMKQEAENKRLGPPGQSVALMMEQNASISKSYQQSNDDLIPQKYISSNSKHQPQNHTNLASEGHQFDHDEENHILERLEPQMTNAKGKVVVEVDKVFQDLQVLYKSMKASKFFRLCVQNSKSGDIPETLFDVTSEDQPEQMPQQDLIVKRYRDLLNYFFKLFVKLNNGADQLTRQNELFRLKLLNQDLREQAFKLKSELNNQLTQEKVNSLVGLLTSDQLLMNMLSQDALNVLNKIQDLTPNLEQLLDHQRCLVDLFTTGNLAVNKNCAEINQKCQIYLEQFEGDEDEEPEDVENMLIDPAATYLDDQNMKYNNDFTMKNSFDNQQYGQDYEEEQYDTTNLIDQQNFTQQNILSSVGGDQNYNIQQANFSQDQAVDLLAQVLQKLTSVQTTQLMNNTQENIIMRPMIQESQSIYASQQYTPGQVSAQQRRASAQTNNFLLNVEDDRRMDKTMHSMIEQNQTVNDDCIRQAESLLQMFKQGTQTNQNSQPHGLGNTATSQMTSISMSHANDNVRASTKSVASNLPLQKMGSQPQRVGSATATWSRNDTGANNSSIISQQDALYQRQQQSRNMIPRNQQRKQTQHVYNQTDNFRSLDQMSNISAGAFSTQPQHLNPIGNSKPRAQGHGGQAPPQVPPLQLKMKSGVTNQHQQAFQTSKSMSHFPNNQIQRGQQHSQNVELLPHQQRVNSLDGRSQNMASAGDYYKQHKKKLMDDRRNSQHIREHIQLSKIEGLVSPISSKLGQPIVQRHDGAHSAQVQLRPVSSNRLNSAQQASAKQTHYGKQGLGNQFQTVELDHKSRQTKMGPGLPKSQHQLHVWQDDRKHQNRNFQTVNNDADDLSHSIGQTEEQEQTLTFRKNRQQAQYAARDESELNQESYAETSPEQEAQNQPGNWYYEDEEYEEQAEGRQPNQREAVLSDNDGSLENDMEERNSQKETIQLYASREVSNQVRRSREDQQPTKQDKDDCPDVSTGGVRSSTQMSLMKIKQRMNNSSSSQSSQKANNRYN